MKTTLNLALPSSARERYSFYWSVPVSAVGLVMLIILTVSAVGDYKSLRRAQATLAHEQGEEAKVREREATLRKELESPALREVYRNSRLINGVIGRREFSILQLVEKTTGLLPDDVRLDGFELDLDGPGRAVRLAVSAEKEESLEKFLINLEDSPDFADVTVTSHILPGEKGDEGSDLATASCIVRYVGGGKSSP